MITGPVTPVGWTRPSLRELGFNVDRHKARKRYKPDIPREVFVVLELDGEPWQEFLKQMDTALEKRRAAYQAAPNDEDLEKEYARFQERVNEVKTSGSRLFAVDAGTDAKSLRAEYSCWDSVDARKARPTRISFDLLESVAKKSPKTFRKWSV